MTTMTRFVPLRSGFEEMKELQHRLNHLFESAATRGEATGSFTPAVDVYEDAQRLVLKLEVPGVKQSDLDLRIENQVLTVKGQRGFEAEEKEENFHRIERRFGSFTRSFTLPQTVDTNAVQAIYLDGVLAVTIAKKAEAKPRQIQVEIGAAAASASAAKAVEVEGQR